MKLAKHINTIVCDDIRQESNDKLSLMGIYQKNIIVDNIPTILPTLCFMFTFDDVKTNLSGLKIEIKQSKNVITLLELDNFPENPDSIETVRLLAKITPFRINKEEKVVIQFMHPDLKIPKTIYSFKIIKKTPLD